MAQSSYNQPPPEYPTYPGPGYYGQTPVGYPPYQPAYAYGGAYGQQGPQAAPAYGAGSDPYAAPAPPPAAYAYQQQEGPTAYGKPSSLRESLRSSIAAVGDLSTGVFIFI